MLLREASYNPVAYIPRQDVDMALLARTDRKTRCPYKGEASYYSIHVDGDGRIAENAVWSYERPLPDVAAIAGHMAFYPDRVEAIERLPLVSSASGRLLSGKAAVVADMAGHLLLTRSRHRVCAAVVVGVRVSSA